VQTITGPGGLEVFNCRKAVVFSNREGGGLLDICLHRISTKILGRILRYNPKKKKEVVLQGEQSKVSGNRQAYGGGGGRETDESKVSNLFKG